MMGRLVTTNLTSGKGGVLANYTDAQLARAIRHGVKPDGTPTLFMPAQEFNHFTDDDVAALVAYIRSLPPVDNVLPPTKLKMLARVLYVTKKLDLVPAELIDHTRKPVPIVPGVTREYGEYLAETGGCFGCHGRGLSGGAIPGAPPSFPKATNITPTGIGKWTEVQFMQAMRSGTRPDGRAIDRFMPWEYVGQLTDDELRALWLFLSSVERGRRVRVSGDGEEGVVATPSYSIAWVFVATAVGRSALLRAHRHLLPILLVGSPVDLTRGELRVEHVLRLRVERHSVLPTARQQP
jgi:mono/diheme cytochrome c family protein